MDDRRPLKEILDELRHWHQNLKLLESELRRHAADMAALLERFGEGEGSIHRLRLAAGRHLTDMRDVPQVHMAGDDFVTVLVTQLRRHRGRGYAWGRDRSRLS